MMPTQAQPFNRYFRVASRLWSVTHAMVEVGVLCKSAHAVRLERR